MESLEHIAFLIIFGIVSVCVIVAKWALGQRDIARAKMEVEAQKRIESELRNEIANKSIDDLVNDSNKRHGRG